MRFLNSLILPGIFLWLMKWVWNSTPVRLIISYYQGKTFQSNLLNVLRTNEFFQSSWEQLLFLALYDCQAIFFPNTFD